MRTVFYTAGFKRAYRRYNKRNQARRGRLDQLLREIALDPFSPRLDTHKLSGTLAGAWSCSCGYDCRIIFLLEPDESSGQDRLVFVDIGTHDEIY